MSRQYLTPADRPNHETIGRIFNSWNGYRWFCDAWEENHGFWMTRLDAPQDRRADLGDTDFRKNVSERAIGATFHRDYSEAAEQLAKDWREDKA